MTINTRNKDFGRSGNGGQFAGRDHDEPITMLERATAEPGERGCSCTLKVYSDDLNVDDRCPTHGDDANRVDPFPLANALEVELQRVVELMFTHCTCANDLGVTRAGCLAHDENVHPVINTIASVISQSHAPRRLQIERTIGGVYLGAIRG